MRNDDGFQKEDLFYLINHFFHRWYIGEISRSQQENAGQQPQINMTNDVIQDRRLPGNSQRFWGSN